MQKVLWLDTETTGLEPGRHGLIEIAGIVDIDGEIAQEFCINSCIFDGDEISEGAARLHEQTLEEFSGIVAGYQAPQLAHFQIKSVFDAYVDKYDRSDKFIVAGYNTPFDVSFLDAFFKKLNDNYLFSYIGSQLDILPVCRYLSWAGVIESENHKLETMCNIFDIPIEAHSALSDIRATRQVGYKIKEMIHGK